MLAYRTREFSNQTPILNYWNDFFNDNYTHKRNDSLIDVSSNLWIYGCTFIKVENNDGKGSCICKDSSASINLLVEYSSFNTCSSSSNGGAIYFYCEGQCVLSSVCGTKCTSGNLGHFCCVYISDDPQCKNHIIDSSVTLTQKKYTYQYATLYHRRGDISCKGVNVSNNEVYMYSGIFLYYPSMSYLSFSSFRNNSAIGDSESFICIENIGPIDYKMENTNIIENTQTSCLYGIIDVDENAKLTMNHCSVFGNCNNDKGKVFYVYSGSIRCTDCAIPKDQKDSQYGSVTIETASESFINYYEYLELNDCKTGLDSWGTLYPVTPISKQTPEKTQESKCFTWYCEDHRSSYIDFYRLLEYIFLLC